MKSPVVKAKRIQLTNKMVDTNKEGYAKMSNNQNLINEFSVVSSEFKKLINYAMARLEFFYKWDYLMRTNFYNKKWIGYSKASNLYKVLVQNPTDYKEKRKGYIAEVARFYPELATQLSTLILPAQEQSPILTQLRGYVNQSTELFSSFIKSDFERIIQSINSSVPDEKLKEKLKERLFVISGRELNELDKCINDIRTWSYRAAYGIDFFIERPKLYLIGGKSKYDGETFFGFHMNFKDLDLSKAIYKTPEVKRLLTYKEELKSFSEARYAIKKSVETQGDWKGFEDFYNNLDSYTKKVREKFGNEGFAKLLEAFKEKRHEDPEGWEHELGELSERLIKRAYPLVIQPAADSLLRIFEARKLKLNGEMEKSLIELKKLLNENEQASKLADRFKKILQTAKKILERESHGRLSRFISFAGPKIYRLDELREMCAKVAQKVDLDKELLSLSSKMGQISDGLHSIQERTTDIREDQESSNELEFVNAAMQAAYSSYGVTRMANDGGRIIENTKIRYAESINIMKRAIAEARNKVIPEVEECVAAVEKELIDYLPEALVYLRTKNSELKESTVN